MVNYDELKKDVATIYTNEIIFSLFLSTPNSESVVLLLNKITKVYVNTQ